MDAGPLDILYRDEHFVAINKPAGLLVHRSTIDRHETRFAVQILRDQLGQKVFPIHRIDKPTSGVLLFGLTAEAAKAMGDIFMSRAVSKQYLAVVRGFAPENGVIDHPLKEQIDKHDDPRRRQQREAQEAVTEYQLLNRIELPVSIDKYPSSRYSLLQLKPLTGRRHQIRRHLKHIAHPIIGDVNYGKGTHNRYFADVLQCPRLLLHASALQFEHPVTQQAVHIQAGLDEKMQQLFARFGW